MWMKRKLRDTLQTFTLIELLIIIAIAGIIVGIACRNMPGRH